MKLIEVDEELEGQCLEDVRRAAEHLRDRMDELLKNAEKDPSRINCHGEVQDLGLRLDLACARYGLMRKLARGAGGTGPGERPAIGQAEDQKAISQGKEAEG